MKENRRRQFLKQILAGTMASMAIPALGHEFSDEIPELPSEGSEQNEAYWEMVKKQFPAQAGFTMMNAANLCPSPYAINELVSTTMKELEMNVSFQFRARFAEKRKKAVEMMAAFTGADPGEIGIVRNTSEANNLVVNGLEFNKGDEIVIWDQNHASNSATWEQRGRRNGIVIKKISVPAGVKTKEELLAPFRAAITGKTKVISFSHISNLTGIALPAKEICALAREKNILTLVDGAQSLGFVDLNLHDLGCDFYSSSTHKWLMGPFENGIIYVRKESMPRMWATLISAGWKDGSATVDEKLCILGQRNETTPFALPETLEFHLAIGKKSIQDRVMSLSAKLKEGIQTKIPSATFITPLSPEISGGIVVVNLVGKTPQELYQKLYNDHGIACAPAGGVRFSPHIYNTMGDIDKAVNALVSLA